MRIAVGAALRPRNIQLSNVDANLIRLDSVQSADVVFA